MTTESEVKQALLRVLSELDYRGARVVSRPVWASALARLRLFAGSPVVDSVLLLCRVNDRGDVDYSAFAAAMGGAAKNGGGTRESQLLVPSDHAQDSSPLKSYEFRQALEASGSSVRPARATAELLAIPRSDRVRALAPELGGLCRQLDSGQLSLDRFRAALRDIGVEETPEATRLLLQQTKLSFSALYRALQSDNFADSNASAAPGPAAPDVLPYASASRQRLAGGIQRPAADPSMRGIAHPGDRQFDPVTWTGDAGVKGPGFLDRRALVSPYNTALASNVLAPPPTLTAKEQHGYMTTETGAGNLIFNKGAGLSAPGAEYGEGTDPAYEFNKRLNKAGQNAEARRMWQGETGISELLAPQAYANTAGGAAYETRAQASDRTGLFGADDTHAASSRVHGIADNAGNGAPAISTSTTRGGGGGPQQQQPLPYTSAGYASTDGGMLREQLASAVRSLSNGRLTSATFRDAVRKLLLPVQLPAAVEKLLQNVDMYGRVDFSKFMLGFEEALAARTTQAERPPTPSAATNGYYATHGSSGITASDMLMRGRGDDFLRPVRPTSYTASGDARTFTEGHTNAGSYYSTHVPPSLKSHGDIVTWTQEHTAPDPDERSRQLGRIGLRDAVLSPASGGGFSGSTANGTTRGSISASHFLRQRDTMGESNAIDIMSVQQLAAMRAVTDLPGRLSSAMELPDALRDRRPNLSSTRYASGGNITSWAGGGFNPEDARAELAKTSGRARPNNTVAVHDRTGGLPYN